MSKVKAAPRPTARQFLSSDDYSDNVDYQSFWYLARYALAQKWKFLGAIAVMLFASCFVIFSARLMGLLVEDGLLAKDVKWSWKIAAAILVLEGSSIALLWLSRRRLAQASTQFVLNIRQKIFAHIHELPMSYFDRQPQGRTVTRMTHDIESMEQFFSSVMARLIQASIMFSIALVAMLVTNWKLGLLMVGGMIPAVVATVLMQGKIREVNRWMSIENSACNSKLSELIKGLPVIRSFGLEEWSQDVYHSHICAYRRAQLAANSYYSWSRPLINLLCFVPLILLLGVGGKSVLDGALSIGIFVAFVRYCERFTYPLANLAREIHVIQQAFTSSERVASFLQAATEDQEMGKDGSLKLSSLEGRIQFIDVGMGYDREKIVLDQLSVSIVPGEKIGLVGRTGSGKSTFVALLSRLYEFQKGQILIDGHPIREFDRSWLRGQIGFVSQDVILFKGSLRENLSFDRSLDDKKLNQLTQATGLQEVMDRAQLNLDSPVLESGANLSIGERQLIALTRVLIQNPKILIMDEATANIDPYFEKIIHEAVHKVMEGRTCLLIAHRLDTIRECDRILVFRDGQVVESGTFEGLVLEKGYFSDLLKSSSEAPGTSQNEL